MAAARSCEDRRLAALKSIHDATQASGGDPPPDARSTQSLPDDRFWRQTDVAVAMVDVCFVGVKWK